jgi:uncharacterized membrane protein
MLRVIHLGFAAAGALLGALIAPGDWRVPGLAGACIGLLVAEMILVRRRILALEREVAGLRALRSQTASAAAAHAASTVEVPNPGSPLDALEELRREERLPRQEIVGSTESAAAPDSIAAPGSYRSSIPPPRAPDDPLLDAVRGFFTGGNALVRAGVVVLFFGVAFLLRYAAEHTRVPIKFRLAGVAAGAVVLLVLGWSLRKSRRGYALALQGGAVGILYLIIFAALHLYALLPASVAFGALCLLAVLSAILAVLQDSAAFAVLAVTGGFLAPILASTGKGDYIVLFSYYAVLNAAIVAIAWFKAWRPLNLAGFAFTFVIGTVWGVLHYRPEDFPTSEPFLVLFFLFYVAAAVLFTLRQPANLRGYVDGTLIFGLPIIAFGLQSAMLHERLLLLGSSATAVGTMYLGIAWLLHRRRNEAQRVLTEAFAALGVAFLTLAVPLALGGRWNAAVWALEGAALIWVGCRQQRRLPRAFGAIMIVAAGCAAAQDFELSQGGLTLPAGAYLGVLAVSAASVFSCHILQVHRTKLEEYEQPFSAGLFLWGLFWWSIGGIGEITQFAPHVYVGNASLAFAALTALLSSELYRRTSVGAAKAAAVCLLPVMALCALLAAGSVQHPFAQGGWMAWPIACVMLYVLARRHEGDRGGVLANTLEVGSTWLLCAMLSWEAAWAIGTGVHGSPSWRAAGWTVGPALALLLLPILAERVTWPFRLHREAYLGTAGPGLAVYLGLWMLITNVALNGDADPLPYLPLLNPLDIAQACVLLAMVRYWRFLRGAELKVLADINPSWPPACLGALAFVWANGVLLRTLHQWAGVPFALESFAQSTLVQSALSIFWALLALATMLAATRNASRAVWLAGASLLAVVVAKLFLVDLSRIGSVERIVSFLGVGLLMLIVGYLSPLPPSRKN